jgi:hypothetical protein
MANISLIHIYAAVKGISHCEVSDFYLQRYILKYRAQTTVVGIEVWYL